MKITLTINKIQEAQLPTNYDIHYTYYSVPRYIFFKKTSRLILPSPSPVILYKGPQAERVSKIAGLVEGALYTTTVASDSSSPRQAWP